MKPFALVLSVAFAACALQACDSQDTFYDACEKLWVCDKLGHYRNINACVDAQNDRLFDVNYRCDYESDQLARCIAYESDCHFEKQCEPYNKALQRCMDRLYTSFY